MNSELNNTEVHYKEYTDPYKKKRSKSLCSSFKTFLLSIFLLIASTAQAQLSNVVETGGYFKELGQLSMSNDFSEIHYDNFLQNRLETQWTFSDSFEFRADLRTRLISGYSINNTPNITSFYKNDPGFVDMTWVPFDGDYSVFQMQIDRFYGSYYRGDFELHAGRQRINWGRTGVWNPNDLFNNFAFLDFDYEERPGVDALLAHYSWDFASSAELGFRMADTFEEMVLAGMVRTHWGSYDVQFVGGHYQQQASMGVGWAGYIQDAGFKGEMTWFQPEDNFLKEPGTLTATVGFDYMLPNSLYLQSELLYNGGFERQNRPLAELNRPPSADDLFIAETGFYLSGNYPVTPLLNTSLGAMGSFDRSVFILIPQISYSLGQNLDLMVLSQLLKGTTFRQDINTQNLFFIQLKWSY